MTKSKLGFIAVLATLLLTAGLVGARSRQIGQLSNFRITRDFAGTSYLQKMNGSYYVVI